MSTAQQVKKELKATFPGIKFSVRKDGYNSVKVEWVNGVTEEAIRNILGKYECGHFDGMQDMFIYNKTDSDLEQVKYTFTRREITEEIREQAFEVGVKYFADLANVTDRQATFETYLHGRGWNADQYMNHFICKADLRGGAFTKELLDTLV